MDPSVRAFLSKTHAAAMITSSRDCTPHAVRVGIALVGDNLWSSGTVDRRRNLHLRRDARATLFVFSPTYSYLTLETRVKIIEGPETGPLSLALFRGMQDITDDSQKVMWNGEPKSDEEFLEIMSAEHRIIYEFEIEKYYGSF